MKTMSIAQRIDVERSVVRGLIRHMRGAGFEVFRVYDGEDWHYTRTEAQALEHVFSVDEASLRFAPAALVREYHKARDAYRPSGEAHAPSHALVRKAVGSAAQAEHGVLLVMGNDGWDVISDWTYKDGDPDGFNSAMEAYCAEVSEREARGTRPVQRVR